MLAYKPFIKVTLLTPNKKLQETAIVLLQKCMFGPNKPIPWCYLFIQKQENYSHLKFWSEVVNINEVVQNEQSTDIYHISHLCYMYNKWNLSINVYVNSKGSSKTTQTKCNNLCSLTRTFPFHTYTQTQKHMPRKKNLRGRDLNPMNCWASAHEFTFEMISVYFIIF